MADRALIIAELAASFPSAKITRETQIAYVRQLADIPADELADVARAHALESEWFPTVRDLRRGVIERRLALPTSDQAWLLVLDRATMPATVTCPARCARGVLAGGKPIKVDRSLMKTIQDRHLRSSLEKIARAAAQPTHMCDICNGEGEIPNPALPEIDGPVKAALAHIGGTASIAMSENIGILRAQFLKAYDHAREDALRTANLSSAGIALHAGHTPAALEERHG